MLTHHFADLINECPAMRCNVWDYSCCRSVQVTFLPACSGKVVELSPTYWMTTLLNILMPVFFFFFLKKRALLLIS